MMKVLKNYILVFCILTGLSSGAFSQVSLYLFTDEINLGKKQDIPLLSPSIKEALTDNGFIIKDAEGDNVNVLQIKISTREGSESQGIFTSFADVYFSLKNKDGKVIGEKSLIGLKGVGLNFAGAGIDAIRKSSGKVVPEILQVLSDHKAEIAVYTAAINQTTDGSRSVDGMPPEIVISSPLLFRNAVISTRSPKMKIEGSVADASGIAKLTINDEDIPISSTGNFSTELSVNEGITQIIIIAEDKYKNQASKVFSIDRSGDVQTKPGAVTDLSSGPGIFYAVIIGINDYQDQGITQLDNPINDATTLYETLISNYTFNRGNIYFLKNPVRSQIIIAFDELSKKVTNNDNLLIFYAGHGQWDNKKKLGYWLPSDAKTSNTAEWIYNSTIQDIIASIPAKHTLLIADACFSGSIFKTRKAFNDAPPSVEKLYELTSRKAMTSGTMTEVPDKSVFLEYLNKRLKENKEPYLSSRQLFTSFEESVSNNSQSTPQYGTIQDTGDDGGDFIFIRKAGNQ
ncbi:MAG: caspase family protein [Bacteroidia bacterium]|jgi:hypothetical protein|nr:caspase family protein [Bacteroidia bacterium]